MIKKDIAKRFENALIELGFNKHKNNLYCKGYVTVKLITGGSRIIVLDNNPKHKHNHITTQMTPEDQHEFHIWLKFCEIDKRTKDTSQPMD